MQGTQFADGHDANRYLFEIIKVTIFIIIFIDCIIYTGAIISNTLLILDRPDVFGTTVPP
jgi:hypothetical protein